MDGNDQSGQLKTMDVWIALLESNLFRCDKEYKVEYDFLVVPTINYNRFGSV